MDWDGKERRKNGGRRQADTTRSHCGAHDITQYRVDQIEVGFKDHLIDTNKWREKVNNNFKSFNQKLVAMLTSAILSLLGIVIILLMNLAKA